MNAKTIVPLIAGLLCVKSLLSQDNRAYNFIGINPSVTVEPYYEKGELDVNIFPLVYQRSLTKRMDVRITTILNLGIRHSGSIISHWGLEAGFPLFFKSKTDRYEISRGFYAAPIISVTRNRTELHSNLGLWVEPGYHLLFENNLAMTFGLQAGATYFDYDNEANKWGNHFGVKIIIGKWL